MTAAGSGRGSSRGSAARRRASAIGVEFAEEQINLVQVCPGAGSGFETIAAASLRYGDTREQVLSEPRRLRTLLTAARRNHPFRGRNAVVSVPPAQVRTLPITYAVQGSEPEPAAFMRALAERVDAPLEDFIVDYIPIRLDKSSDNRLAIAVLAERTATLEFLDQLRRAGLNVTSLEIGPVALRRFVTALMSDSRDEVVMIINFGSHSSYLTVLSGRRLVFDQQVDLGEAAVIDRVASALDVAQPEARDLVRRHGFAPASADAQQSDVGKALIEITRPVFTRFREQIDRAVVFAVSENRGRPVGRVYVGGSLARVHGTSALLSELLHLPVSPLPDPTSQLDDNQRNDCARPELAVATGLSLKGLVEVGDVELVPGDYRAAAQRRHSLVRSAAAAGAGLAACAAVTATLFTWTAGIEADIARLQQSRAITDSLKARLADLESRRGSLFQRMDRLAVVRRQSATVELFQAIDRAFVPDQLWLVEWAFSRHDEDQPSNMALRGQALDHGALSRFVRQLLGQPEIEGVEVVRTTQVEEDTTTLVAFELTVVLAGERAG